MEWYNWILTYTFLLPACYLTIKSWRVEFGGDYVLPSFGLCILAMLSAYPLTEMIFLSFIRMLGWVV